MECETDEYPAEFEAVPALRESFLKECLDSLGEQRAVDGSTKLEILSVTMNSFVGETPKVQIRYKGRSRGILGTTEHQGEATVDLEDYHPENHEAVLAQIVEQIASARGWDTADVELVHIAQLAVMPTTTA